MRTSPEKGFVMFPGIVLMEMWRNVMFLLMRRRTTLRAHDAKTRALRSITNLLANNANLTDLSKLFFDIENEPPANEDNSSWLKNNDLSK
jgi:hypothetical protein